MPDTHHTFVYGLHEGDRAFWYVGMTSNPDRRVGQHRRSNPRFTADTQLHVLDEVTGTLDEVREVEQLWIDGLLAIGYPLVNTWKDRPYTGSWSDETRRRRSQAQRGTPKSETHKANFRAAWAPGGARRIAHEKRKREAVTT
jgi:hypothetical protein